MNQDESIFGSLGLMGYLVKRLIENFVLISASPIADTTSPHSSLSASLSP